MAGKPRRYEALLTQGVEQGLEFIHDYIAEFDCVANANYVLDQLMKAVEALVKYPEKGSDPEELVALGIKEYRQTTFKPYRVIYLVVDGCRDMQSLLACRLLGA
ncbi:MAG: type II toxin-antitoxin system RelE/ParE family toxin [Propionivibrio sp.]|jgi:toxin ParE1/3/4|nr:type II toxin-antitoxin system RelE/ParE family toxin [Propionivibrio sp.]MBP6712139.1 type II toxin-antitoxin system RelE/ParE family toxin [Propionivibrio sp.]MBP7525574.1 type II toxin-antitoxin system RelE/ParE family toxin [Propionivibrio sp.]MBP8163509.1 type II toxin-antitoxin system RelE/ParE family toxin [Propionivibrio sp.]